MTTRTKCGLCGQLTRHIGSHVLNAHLPYYRTQEQIRAALEAERTARMSVAV